MKRLYLLLVAAIIATLPTLAQTTSRWGVTAGVNLNEIHFKQHDIVDVDRGLGPIIGVTGEMNIPGVGFAVDGSLLYSMRGGKIHYGDKTIWSSLGYGDERCTMHYIDVPLNLKFKYHNLGGTETTIMPMVFAGPTFSFLVGKNLGEVNSYKTVNVLLHMGLGVELFERLQVQVAYNFNVGETLHTRLLDQNIAKNRAWTATLTYYFKK